MIRLQIKKGLDIDLGSVPAETERIVPSAVALLGSDYPGVRPSLEVEVGAVVRKGDTLVVDRARPEIRLTAPASGRVSAVHRGARRSLESVVIDVEDGDDEGSVAGPAAADSAVSIRETLLRVGLWSALRTRPYDRVPEPAAAAREIYVTAMDTNPLAPDPAGQIARHREPFARGLEVVAALAESSYLCTAAGAGVPCPQAPGLTPVEIVGPHPAGLAGTHIYEIARAEGRRPTYEGIWHIGYQDVIAIGYLFLDGRLFTERCVSVAGPGMTAPRTATTLLGADLAALTGSLDGAWTVLSGPVLSGRTATPTTGYLGRYHHQVVVLPPAPAQQRPVSGMLSLEAFERVWPFEVPVLPVLRALLIEDAESFAALGCTLLAPEDLALCSYMCPARIDYGAALERTLDEIRRGG